MARARSALDGQGQQQGLEGRVGGLVGQRAAHGLGEALLAHLVGPAGGAGQDQVAGQVLAGLPAVEQVRVGGQQHVAVLGLGASVVSITGAEKPRRAETTGGRSTPSGRRLVSASSSTITVSSTASPSRSKASVRPSSSSRPRRTGIGRGRLVGWPGVGAVAWVSVELQRRGGLVVGGWSTRDRAACRPVRTRRRSRDRSWPEASAKQLDEVLDRGGVAVPALEVEVHARRGRPRRPIRVFSMRMTSAPFS